MIFADFGIALDANDLDSTTTTGLPDGFTCRYQAPEVAKCEPRNRKTDIFSLGCVFLEIMAVLAPGAVTGLEDRKPYWERTEEIKNMLRCVNGVENEYAQVFPILSSMLEPDRSIRINTQDLVDQLRRMHESEPRLHQTMDCKECENFSQDIKDTTVDNCEAFNNSTFSPYLSEEARNVPKEALLMKLALKPMHTFEMGSGYMYIFSHPDEPHFVHIGHTKDVPRQLRQWEKHYGTPVIGYCGSPEDFRDGGIFCKHVARVEQLVMNDLRDVRYRRLCRGCGLTHMQYFRTSPENAVMAIKNFSSRQ